MELARFGNQQDRKNVELARNRQIKSFQQASGVIFCSEYSRNIIIKSIPSMRLSCVVPLAVEPEFYIRNKFILAKNKQTNLLYVSPLYSYKNHLEVIQAVKFVRRELEQDLRLRLVGRGSADAQEKIQSFILQEESAEYVDLVGFVDDKLLMEEYQKADIFIFASSCEAFPITLLEAMASHLPIACSKLVGLPDILKDAGEYFDPKGPEFHC